MTEGMHLAGTGKYLPPGTLDNTQLARRFGVKPSWILERTGVRSRRFGDEGTTSMAVKAAKSALDRASCSPHDIALVVVATTTPDLEIPSTASSVQGALGCVGAAFDINAACTGFVYGLVSAVRMLPALGMAALVIGADSLTRVTDPNDRDTAILMGDGAGAVVIRMSDTKQGLRGFDLGGDGGSGDLLWAPRGGTMRMQGGAVFRRAVKSASQSTMLALDSAGLTPTDVDHFVPHQANGRIIEAIRHRLEFPESVVHNVIAEIGNTSAASIPLTLALADDGHLLHAGQVVAMTGFGAGMTWGSAIWEL